MSGSNLRTKPKFIRLYTMLDITPVLARGLLEFLWDSAADTGDPDVGDAAAVEAASGWTGEQGKFCDALLRCGSGKAGFIERCPGNPSVYRLHDLLANSSDEQIRVWCRRQARAERGPLIADVRASKNVSRTVASLQKPPIDTNEAKSPSTSTVVAPSNAPTNPPLQPAAASRPLVQNATTACKRPAPDIPTLLEVKDHLARYGFKGNPADFLLQYRPESLPAKEAADWKVAAVDWLRRAVNGNGNEIDRLLAAVR